MSTIAELQILRIRSLPDDLDTNLIPLAMQESFGALEWLSSDWISGINRFSKPGEGLFTARYSGQLVGVCGVNQDPYTDGLSIGRLRRLYVHPECRRIGIGSKLVACVIEESRKHFIKYHVRTVDSGANSFYLALGFEPVIGDQAVTHRYF